MDRKVILHAVATGLTAVTLAGCGLVPRMAQQTTAAALAPFTTAANAAATNMQILGRGMQYMTAQTSQTTRQITAMNNTARAYQPRPVSYQPAPTRRPTTTNRAPSAAKKDSAVETRKDPAFDVLPKDVLVRLTEDQAGLQKAAQSAAMTGPVGETVFWRLEGREGSVTTETESVRGGFTCRTFMQTIALEDYFDKASLTACRNESGAWLTSF